MHASTYVYEIMIKLRPIKKKHQMKNLKYSNPNIEKEQNKYSLLLCTIDYDKMVSLGSKPDSGLMNILSATKRDTWNYKQYHYNEK